MGVLAVYIGLSVALHHRVVPDLAGRATGSIASDSGLFTWWLQWGWWSTAHGLNPLYTTWQNAPGGVNAMWNTTVPVLAIVLSPITTTVGPVAAFNVGMILGPAVSALACYGALGPMVARRWPRVIGGVMFGFSPFAIAHSWVGHLNIVWMLLPPALLWAVRAIAVEARRPWRDGAVLGLIFAVQTGLYTQTVALGAVVFVVAVLILMAHSPALIRERVPAVVRSAIACGAVYLVLCAYPLWLLLTGPGRPRAPIRDETRTGADVANLVVPTVLTKVQAGTGSLAGELRGYVGEQGSYIGVALVLVLFLASVLMRDAAVRVVVSITFAVTVLSLGVSLTFLGRDVGVGLPWRLVSTLPIVSEAEAGRLAPFVALGVATVLVLVLDRVIEARQWIAVALVLVAAGSWVPSDSQQTTRTTVPAFFSQAASHLRPGETVEIWPRPSGRWADGADPLVWQATSTMAFRQSGGYFIGSDATHDLLLESPVSEFQRGAAGRPADPIRARLDLRARRVTSILVVPTPQMDVLEALHWTTAVAGRPGRLVDEVWVFEVG